MRPHGVTLASLFLAFPVRTPLCYVITTASAVDFVVVVVAADGRTECTVNQVEGQFCAVSNVCRS